MMILTWIFIEEKLPLPPDAVINNTRDGKWEITSGSINYTIAEESGALYVFMSTRGAGFLGVGVNDHEATQAMVSHPVQAGFETGETATEKAAYAVYNVVSYSVLLPLPQTGLMPFHSPFTDAFEITGPLAFMGPTLFWEMANYMYYIFWINLLLGAFNALPMIPMDGGVTFRDLIHSTALKIKKDKEKADTIANAATLGMTLFLVATIIWVFIAPWI